MITILFLLKVAWNFLVPLLLVRMEKSGSSQRRISMMPIEVVFWLLVVVYAFVKNDFYIFGLGSLGIAFVGAGLIVLSYMTCIVFAWYKTKKN
ncbi:hypothetical protein [Zooshikella ganghwensis]|nr:hypothetical protein [Zooshikella ganghwensis]